MKKNNLDAFKNKAESILLTDALLNVTGGAKIQDAEYCHVDGKSAHGRGKLEMGYSAEAVAKFFSDASLSLKFDEMYDPTDPDSSDRRDAFFRSVVG